MGGVAAQLNQQLKRRSPRLPLGTPEARTEESSFCAGGSSGGCDVVLMCVWGVWGGERGGGVAAQLKRRSPQLQLGTSEARTEESSFCAGGSSGGCDEVLVCVWEGGGRGG